MHIVVASGELTADDLWASVTISLCRVEGESLAANQLYGTNNKAKCECINLAAADVRLCYRTV